MLTVMEAIQQRRSIRRYLSDPVPEESIRLILEAARLAPSGSNSQPWRFIVVTEAEEKQQLREFGFGQRWLTEAPAIIVCCADLEAYTSDTRKLRRQEMSFAGIDADFEGSTILQRIETDIAEAQRQEMKTFIPTASMNAAIAIQNMVLTATSLGLGTCWMGGFDGRKLREMFGLPRNIIIVALLPVGYPAQSPAPRPRLALDEILLRPLPEAITVAAKRTQPAGE